jgi:hypothetical protein
VKVASNQEEAKRLARPCQAGVNHLHSGNNVGKQESLVGHLPHDPETAQCEDSEGG